MIAKSEEISLLDGRLEQCDADDQDFDLLVSYSRLEVFDNCPLRYDLKYNKGLFGLSSDTIALSMGSLAHKALELKLDMVRQGEEVDYDYLERVIHNGYVGSNVSDTDEILGVEDIKSKFGIEEYYNKPEGEMNYEEKVDLFIDQVLHTEMNKADGWVPVEAEHQFCYKYLLPYKDETKVVKFVGFIDRIDQRPDGSLRVIDYKTSRKTYDDTKTKTSLQMLTYALAIYLETGQLPSEYQYSFVFLNERQEANSPGYLKRGLKKIDKMLTQIFENQETSEWAEKGTPLCYWCEYRPDSILKDPIVGGLCLKYCEWTPENKVFTKHDEASWQHKPDTLTKRKLFF